MERLFTETQWRAIAEVEERTDYEGYRVCLFSKPLLGGAFSAGDFRLGFVPKWQAERFVGPPIFECYVFECTSAWNFTWLGSKEEVIRGARARIVDMGPENLADLIARGRRYEAEREAQRAIREAQIQKPKPRKPTKRASAVFEGSGGKCHYCATTLTLDGKWHIEHKMPRALKGGSEQSNLVAACVPCNMRKKDKTDLEFQALLQAEQAVETAQRGVVSTDPVSLPL